MDPERVTTLAEWPEPEGYRDIQIFLGFANFYRRFVWGYSDLIRPLQEHMTAAQKPPDGHKAKGKKTKKGPTRWYKDWSWPEDVRQSFLKIREAFCTAPVLVHFDPRNPIMLITDASDFAMARIVLQYDRNAPAIERHWRPVAYHSRKFNGPEVRYHTHDKELLAIVECFGHWRHYFGFTQETIRVLCDHNNLKYFMTTKALTSRQARWAELLAEFDFEIEYKPGDSNPADAPSRRPDYASGFKQETKRVANDTMLPTLQNKLRVWNGPPSVVKAVLQAAYQNQSRPGSPMDVDSTQTVEAMDIDGTDMERTSPGNAPVPNAGIIEAKNLNISEDDISHILRESSDHNEVDPNLHRLVAAVRSSAEALSSFVPTAKIRKAAEGESPFLEQPPESLIDFLRMAQERDPLYVSHMNSVDSERKRGRASVPLWTRDEHELLRYEGKVWVPQCQPLRLELLRRNHDDPLAGHYGKDRTREILRRKYYWPKMAKEINAYIEQCDSCARHKTRRHKPYGILRPLEPPSAPWQDFAMDFITDLPTSKDRNGVEYDSVLVVIDRFSKYVQYVPVRKTIDAKELALVIKERVFLKTGCPQTLLTDRGTVFTSEYWSSVCYHLAVHHRFSTAFHPQTDGQTERQNQELEMYLRHYCNYNQNNWAQLLPCAEFAYNSKRQESTKMSPIQIAFGRPPATFDGIPDDHWLPSQSRPPEGAEPDSILARRAKEHLEAWKKDWIAARDALEHAQELQQRYYNRKRIDFHFQENQLVLLNAKHIKTKRPCKKLDAKYLGPFEIAKKLGKATYRLKLPPGMSRIHPVFNVNLLEEYLGDTTNFQPGPISHLEVEGDRYEVEEILGHRVTNGTTYFLVKWYGWSEEHNTWEPEGNLDNCQEILERYWKNPQSIPERPTRTRGRRTGNAATSRAELLQSETAVTQSPAGDVIAPKEATSTLENMDVQKRGRGRPRGSRNRR